MSYELRIAKYTLVGASICMGNKKWYKNTWDTTQNSLTHY